MPAPVAIKDAVQTPITSDEALKIARLDAEKAYRDLTPHFLIPRSSFFIAMRNEERGMRNEEVN